MGGKKSKICTKAHSVFIVRKREFYWSLSFILELSSNVISDSCPSNLNHVKHFVSLCFCEYNSLWYWLLTSAPVLPIVLVQTFVVWCHLFFQVNFILVFLNSSRNPAHTVPFPTLSLRCFLISNIFNVIQRQIWVQHPTVTSCIYFSLGCGEGDPTNESSWAVEWICATSIIYLTWH